MKPESPLLFALDGSQAYAGRVAAHLGLDLAAHEERVYEDGECKSRPLLPVSGRQVLVVHSLYADAQQSGHDKLCRLLFFCGALKDAGACSVQVLAPYLCYGRKERRTQEQDPIITRYVAALFEACKVDRLLTLEVHSEAAFDNAFRIPTRNLAGAELLADYFAPRLGADEPLVAISPDSGGIKRAEQFRLALQQRLGRPVSSAYLVKQRINDQVTQARLVGTVAGMTALIVDDLVNTGSTLLHAAQACQAAGARRILAGAMHGLFTGSSAWLDQAPLERLVVADTVEPWRLPAEQRQRRLDILDSSTLVAAQLATDYGLQR